MARLLSAHLRKCPDINMHNRVSKFMNSSVWDFDLSWPSILKQLFQPFTMDYGKLGWNHLSGETDFPILLLLCTHPRLSQAVFFIEWGRLLLCSLSGLCKYCSVLLWSNWLPFVWKQPTTHLHRMRPSFNSLFYAFKKCSYFITNRSGTGHSVSFCSWCTHSTFCHAKC